MAPRAGACAKRLAWCCRCPSLSTAAALSLSTAASRSPRRTLLAKFDSTVSTALRTDGGYNSASLALGASTLTGAAAWPRADLDLLNENRPITYKCETENGLYSMYFRRGDAVGASNYRNNLFYVTDNHIAPRKKGSMILVKTSFSASWEPSVYGTSFFHPHFPTPPNKHAPCYGVSQPALGEHICIQRWCCGDPNAGMVINGGAWSGAFDEYPATCWARPTEDVPAPGVRDGSTPDRAAASCRAVRAASPTSISGPYYINPTPDVSGTHSIRSFCDFDSDGGAWQLVFKSQATAGGAAPQRNSAGHNLAELAVDPFLTPGGFASAPRWFVDSVGHGAEYRQLSSDGSRRMYWRRGEGGSPSSNTLYFNDAHMHAAARPTRHVMRTAYTDPWLQGTYGAEGGLGFAGSHSPSVVSF